MNALLQGDAFALAVVFQFLYEKKSIHAANFRLVNSQFFGIACKFQHLDFEHLIVMPYGEKYDFPILIKHANFAKQLRKITIYDNDKSQVCLMHFAGQLEKIVNHSKHMLDITNVDVFPKLRSLHLSYHLVDNKVQQVVDNLKEWLARAPQLETLHLSLGRNCQSDATDAIVKKVIVLIEKVPRIKLQLLAIDATQCVASIQQRIVKLDCSIVMPESFVHGFSNLQSMSLPQIVPWSYTSSFWSQMNKLNHLELKTHFASVEKELFMFSLLPVSLRKLTLRGNWLSFPNIAHLKLLENLNIAGYAKEFDTPDWFASLHKLTTVSLTCFGKSISVTHLPCHLRRLALSQCNWNLDIVPPTLRTVSLSSINFLCFPSTWNMLAEMSFIGLNEQDKLMPFPQLQVLHLVSDFPLVLDQIPQSIVKIELMCQLTLLPSVFCTLPSLEYLNLSNNAIEQLEDSLLDASTGNFANLTHLILKNNKICKYPSKITLPKLQMFIMDTIDAIPDSVTIEPAQVARSLYDPIARTELQRMQSSYSIRFADIGIAYAIACRTELILNVHYVAQKYSFMNDIEQIQSEKGQVSLLVEPTNGNVRFAMWTTIDRTMFDPFPPQEMSWDDYEEENND